MPSPERQPRQLSRLQHPPSATVATPSPCGGSAARGTRLARPARALRAAGASGVVRHAATDQRRQVRHRRARAHGHRNPFPPPGAGAAPATTPPGSRARPRARPPPRRGARGPAPAGARPHAPASYVAPSRRAGAPTREGRFGIATTRPRPDPRCLIRGRRGRLRWRCASRVATPPVGARRRRARAGAPRRRAPTPARARCRGRRARRTAPALEARHPRAGPSRSRVVRRPPAAPAGPVARRTHSVGAVPPRARGTTLRGPRPTPNAWPDRPGGALARAPRPARRTAGQWRRSRASTRRSWLLLPEPLCQQLAQPAQLLVTEILVGNELGQEQLG